MPNLDELSQAVNIADLLEENELNQIGSQAVRGYEIDEDSRAEWSETIDKAMDIAKQVAGVKNTPWPNSSNIQYPLISQAAIDFASRTYPEIIQNKRVVKAAVIGNDADGEIHSRADRIAKHMSFQLLHGNDGAWEESTDRLIHVLPILGTVFKKTFYDSLKKQPVSELCLPDKVVINNNAQSLSSARRVTHVLTVYQNDIISMQRAGIYSDIEIKEIEPDDESDSNDNDGPIELLEQHNFIDLDGDGYLEPYIVTVIKKSGKVLRIVNRFKAIEKNKRGEVQSITAIQHFTDFHYLRSPDGSFYSTGLGTLLYPLNNAINTLINQLIDAGTLNNSQSGLLGRGLRLKGGEFKLKMGEWRVLDAAAGTNLAQNVFPLPTKEPSQTLFNLLGLLIDVGKELVSNTETMKGKGQTQNVASQTVLTLVEQGMKVFNAIHKRLFKSLKKEYRKIYELNKTHLSQKDYANVLNDDSVDVKLDYSTEGLDIIPVADPSLSSQEHRIARAQLLQEMPNLNNREATIEFLEALQLDDETIQRMVPPEPDPDAPPPPEVQKLMAETAKLNAEAQLKQMEAQLLQQNAQLEQMKVQISQMDAQTRQGEAQARSAKMKSDAEEGFAKVNLTAQRAQHKAQLSEIELEHKIDLDESQVTLDAVKINKDNNSNEGK